VSAVAGKFCPDVESFVPMASSQPGEAAPRRIRDEANDWDEEMNGLQLLQHYDSSSEEHDESMAVDEQPKGVKEQHQGAEQGLAAYRAALMPALDGLGGHGSFENISAKSEADGEQATHFVPSRKPVKNLSGEGEGGPGAAGAAASSVGTNMAMDSFATEDDGVIGGGGAPESRFRTPAQASSSRGPASKESLGTAPTQVLSQERLSIPPPATGPTATAGPGPDANNVRNDAAAGGAGGIISTSSSSSSSSSTTPQPSSTLSAALLSSSKGMNVTIDTATSAEMMAQDRGDQGQGSSTAVSSGIGGAPTGAAVQNIIDEREKELKAVRNELLATLNTIADGGGDTSDHQHDETFANFQERYRTALLDIRVLQAGGRENLAQTDPKKLEQLEVGAAKAASNVLDTTRRQFAAKKAASSTSSVSQAASSQRSGGGGRSSSTSTSGIPTPATILLPSIRSAGAAAGGVEESAAGAPPLNQASKPPSSSSSSSALNRDGDRKVATLVMSAQEGGGSQHQEAPDQVPTDLSKLPPELFDKIERSVVEKHLRTINTELAKAKQALYALLTDMATRKFLRVPAKRMQRR
jgi:hypothetical protein